LNNRPANLRNDAVPLSAEMEAGREAFRAVMEVAMPPALVAGLVFDAIRNEQFFIVTHWDWLEMVHLRTEKLLWLENPEGPQPAVMKIIHSKR
jgi:hypothetical protein